MFPPALTYNFLFVYQEFDIAIATGLSLSGHQMIGMLTCGYVSH